MEHSTEAQNVTQQEDPKFNMPDSETHTFSVLLIWEIRSVGWRVSLMNRERNGIYKGESLCSLGGVGVFHLCTESHIWFDNKMISALVMIWDVTLGSHYFMCTKKGKKCSLLGDNIPLIAGFIPVVKRLKCETLLCINEILHYNQWHIVGMCFISFNLTSILRSIVSTLQMRKLKLREF